MVAVRRWGLGWAVAWSVACGPVVGLDGDGGLGSDGDGGTVGTTATSATTASATVGTTSSGTTGTSTSDTGAATVDPDTVGDSATFLIDPDVPESIACDLWQQDCPRGEKCMPWANDGGQAWNATRCSPIAARPNAIGEPCSVVGSAVSGLDDCEFGAMCWNVDPDTLSGTCYAQCTGSEAAPLCPDACDSCTVSGSGVINICLPPCDPLAPDCDPAQVCVPVFDGFSCVPLGVSEPANVGEPCEYVNVCAAGTVCVDGACDGVTGCCSPVCATDGPDGCDAMLPGTSCQPWSDAPSDACGLANLGVCLLP